MLYYTNSVTGETVEGNTYINVYALNIFMFIILAKDTIYPT